MKYRFFLALLSVTLFSGCGVLLPKKVELFQDKVQKFPEHTRKENEVQKQAALRASERAAETLEAAIRTEAAPEVVVPAKETAELTDVVSESLGPPLKASSDDSAKLVAELRATIAKLDRRIEKFEASNNENAGKKIEGTGFFQIGYFSMWAIILGALAIIWFGLKVWGTINPVVGLGTNVVGRVSSALLHRGLKEATEGGEWFKEYLKESALSEKDKATVKDLFARSHTEAQSRDVQTLISRLTEK